MGYIVIVSYLSSDPFIVAYEQTDITFAEKAIFEGNFLIIQKSDWVTHAHSVIAFKIDFLSDVVIEYVDEVQGYNFEMDALWINSLSAREMICTYEPGVEDTEGVRVLFTDSDYGLRAADFCWHHPTVVHNMPLSEMNIHGFIPKSTFMGVVMTGMEEDDEKLTLNFTVSTKEY